MTVEFDHVRASINHPDTQIYLLNSISIFGWNEHYDLSFSQRTGIEFQSYKNCIHQFSRSYCFRTNVTIQTTDSEIGRGNRDLAAREQSENGERGEQTRRNRRRSGEI